MNDGGRRRLALYVDDFALNRLVMQNLFEAVGGWSVDLAEDAASCLEHVGRSRPDLLLIDIHLDGVEGTALLQRLRQLPGLAEVPAVAVSADGQPGDIDAARAAGFDDYWVKPIDKAQVGRTLATLFLKR